MVDDKNIRREMMTDTGTTQYKAPEMFSGGKYTEIIDEWGVGVVLFEIVERRLPFLSEYQVDSIQNIR